MILPILPILLPIPPHWEPAALALSLSLSLSASLYCYNSPASINFYFTSTSPPLCHSTSISTSAWPPCVLHGAPCVLQLLFHFFIGSFTSLHLTTLHVLLSFFCRRATFMQSSTVGLRSRCLRDCRVAVVSWHTPRTQRLPLPRRLHLVHVAGVQQGNLWSLLAT